MTDKIPLLSFITNYYIFVAHLSITGYDVSRTMPLTRYSYVNTKE